ncbi:MAG: H+transporting two-sector ATPase C subunit [Pseudomonadales bacterium]|nr:H+transporting two-sector ATPase C subunit [Pseudomonadales bacterium]
MSTSNLKRNVWLLFGALLALILLLAFASIVLWVPEVVAAEPGSTVPVEALKWGFGAAAAATGVSSLAAGYAVAHVGSAGVGAMAEKPDLFGRILVMVGLAEGIAIYGLIISILILNQLG